MQPVCYLPQMLTHQTNLLNRSSLTRDYQGLRYRPFSWLADNWGANLFTEVCASVTIQLHPVSAVDWG